MSINLNVHPRGKPIRKLPKEIDVSSTAASSELYKAVASKSGSSVHRLRITKGSDGSLVPNTNDSIHSTGLRNQSVVYVKDLGPQIAWRTVFVIEYFGPLVIPALSLYVLRPLLYFNFDKPLPEPSQRQLITLALLTIHFLKREYETLFVHRFSLATMPAFNIFKNSAHYWLLSGINIAYWVFRPDAPTATTDPSPLLLYIGLALYIIGELGNLNAHLILRDLRKPGTTERGIPRGLGFNLVTCPNYMFEVMSWVGVYLVSELSWSVLLFIIVSTGQMYLWAQKKERRYRKEFGDRYKRKRCGVVPGIC